MNSEVGETHYCVGVILMQNVYTLKNFLNTAEKVLSRSTDPSAKFYIDSIQVFLQRINTINIKNDEVETLDENSRGLNR